MRKSTPTPERFGKPTGPDVLLLVGREADRQTFILSESILRQLGTRWEALLSRQSTTNKQKCSRWLSNTPKTLNLRDDQPSAIRVLLLIASLQLDKIPKTLDFVDIVHLTDVAVRYNARSLLAGYVDGWVAPYRDRLRARGYEEWLYVAQEFGYEAEYKELARFLVLNCQVDESGERLLRSGSDRAIEGRISVDTLGQIRRGRRRILYEMLKAAYDLWATISSGTNCRIAKGDVDVERSCAAMNLFALTDFLRGLSVFPMLRTVAAIRAAPSDFALELSDITSTMRTWHASRAHRRNSAPVEVEAKHTHCHFGFKLRAQVMHAVGDVSWQVDEHEQNDGSEYLDPACGSQGAGEGAGACAGVDDMAAVGNLLQTLANCDEQ